MKNKVCQDAEKGKEAIRILGKLISRRIRRGQITEISQHTQNKIATDKPFIDRDNEDIPGN